MLKATTVVACALALMLAVPSPAGAKDKEASGAVVIASSKNDVSPRLATIPPKSEDASQAQRERPLRGFPHAASGARTDQPVSVREGRRWLTPGQVRSSSDTRPTNEVRGAGRFFMPASIVFSSGKSHGSPAISSW